MNPNFEKELSPETEKMLQEKYEEGVKAFQERINFVDVPIKRSEPEEDSPETESEENWIFFGDDWQ